jgi:predicted site-specific integrase-resolvase
MNGQFYFTITDVARLLGKSPVTLRTWERKGLVSWPRDSAGGDRKFTTAQVRAAVDTAYRLGRITKRRGHLVNAAMTLLEEIERKP